MNLPHPPAAEAGSRSRAPGEPADAAATRTPHRHRQLRTGLAAAVVLAAVGVGPSSPPATFPERTTAAGTVPAAAAGGPQLSSGAANPGALGNPGALRNPAAGATPDPAMYTVAAGDAAGIPAAAPALAPASAPPGWTINVAGAGGQSLVDACIGPIHYTPNDDFSLFITEHDFCGGWDRFAGITVGGTVSIPGYGTYTVTGRGEVPNPGTTNDVLDVFGGFPRAILQTCIPGTSRILLIALN